MQVQQRKHGASKNPLKALAINQDLSHQQYTENKSNLLLQRSLETCKYIYITNNLLVFFFCRYRYHYKLYFLATIKVPLAREALAALASIEDFASVNLRKSGDLTPTILPPYKDLMLLHIKGRRRVQTRLVSPTANSVNQGDCYVLVTSSQVRFNFIVMLYSPMYCHICIYCIKYIYRTILP